MRDIWIISDTHFHHRNILKFTDDAGHLIRGAVFSSVEEMDNTLVDNWNSVVKPQDIVYHLGDVFIGPKDNFLELYKRLNGHKRLIVGNHDPIKWMAQNNLFSKILMWRQWPEFGLLFSHVPLDPSGLYDHRNKRPFRNVHGHIHERKSPTEQHFNVSVEAIGYTPIHIEDLRIY